MDVVSREVRTRMMAGIRREHTAPEQTLRRAMFSRGFRYVSHAWWLPGSPDLLFPRYSAAVFVHGCFWHRHQSCSLAAWPKSNADFWAKKFAANVSRDADATSQLLMLGLRVAVVWECAIRQSAVQTAETLATWLASDNRELEVGSP